jgi:hypothetical protein
MEVLELASRKRTVWCGKCQSAEVRTGPGQHCRRSPTVLFKALFEGIEQFTECLANMSGDGRLAWENIRAVVDAAGDEAKASPDFQSAVLAWVMKGAGHAQ